jgi:hypothetical protein
MSTFILKKVFLIWVLTFNKWYAILWAYFKQGTTNKGDTMAKVSQEKIDQFVDMLQPEAKEAVESVNKKIATTKDNYGEYMKVLSIVGNGNSNITKIFALAMIKAGGNRNGINSALKVMGL